MPFSLNYAQHQNLGRHIMQEVYQYLVDSASPSVELQTDGTFDAIDIWGDGASGKISVESCTLTTPESLLDWVDKNSSETTPSTSCNSRSYLGRIVVADRDSTMTWRSPCGPVADRFGLRLAHDYAVGSMMGLTTFPPAQTQPGTRAYAAVHTTLATIWSQETQELEVSSRASSETTSGAPRLQAIILTSPKERAEVRRILQRPWDSSLFMHPMFLALLVGLVLGQLVNKTHNTIHLSVRSIEARTGHHNSSRLLEQVDYVSGSWGHLSAKMSGFARKLANTSRKIEMTHKLHEFMLLHAAEDDGTTELVKHQLELLKGRVDMQRLQNDFLVQKVNIQLTAVSACIRHPAARLALIKTLSQLFNLTARKDSATGLKSATSMEILALVALLFLPGNFVAALFSAPLFDWEHAPADDTDGIGVGIKPQFHLFVAITVPLTVLAFIAYAGWSVFQRWRFQRTTDEERG